MEHEVYSVPFLVSEYTMNEIMEITFIISINIGYSGTWKKRRKDYLNCQVQGRGSQETRLWVVTPPPAQLTVETKWQRDNFCGKIFLCLHFFKYLFRQQQAIKHFCISFVVDYTHAFFLCCELFVCFCVRTCLYPRLNVTCDRLVY